MDLSFTLASLYKKCGYYRRPVLVLLEDVETILRW
jgi:hypothetical protein